MHLSGVIPVKIKESNYNENSTKQLPKGKGEFYEVFYFYL